MKSAYLVTAMLAMTPAMGLGQSQQDQQSQQSLSCVKDARYNQEFLARYPRLPAACTRVVDKDGQKWVRFAADVVKVRSSRVTANFVDKFGHSIGMVTIQAPRDARVLVRGRELPYSLLKPGDKIAFWMPESSAGFYASPDASSSTHLAIVTMRQWGLRGRER